MKFRADPHFFQTYILLHTHTTVYSSKIKTLKALCSVFTTFVYYAHRFFRFGTFLFYLFM